MAAQKSKYQNIDPGKLSILGLGNLLWN